MMKNKKRFVTLILFAGFFFLGLLLLFGVKTYNDSDQYITMHIHRDPGYPLYLWVLRCLSESHYMFLAGFFQAIIATWCTASFVDYIAEKFILKKRSVVIVFIFTLIPHFITPLFSATRLILTNAILTESLCLPLFLVFVKELHRAVVEEDKKAVAYSFVLSFIISLIRAQLMATIIIWLIVLLINIIIRKKYKKAVIYLLAICVFFSAKLLITKTYNYCVHGEFINTTYGNVNTLANILYATDREQGNAIEDEELKKVFYMLYDSANDLEYNYKFADGDIWTRAEYLENVHDRIKFDVCEADLRRYVRAQGIDGYILEDIRADEYASELIKELFPGCMKRWTAHYLTLGIRGAIRNIAIVHPILNIYALAMGAIGIGLTFLFFRNDRKSKEAWLMLIALLSIAGIAFSTAYTIMCLSRYMIYGFTVFYTAIYLMLCALIKNIRVQE